MTYNKSSVKLQHLSVSGCFWLTFTSFFQPFSSLQLSTSFTFFIIFFQWLVWKKCVNYSKQFKTKTSVLHHCHPEKKCIVTCVISDHKTSLNIQICLQPPPSLCLDAPTPMSSCCDEQCFCNWYMHGQHILFCYDICAVPSHPDHSNSVANSFNKSLFPTNRYTNLLNKPQVLWAAFCNLLLHSTHNPATWLSPIPKHQWYSPCNGTDVDTSTPTPPGNCSGHWLHALLLCDISQAILG